MKLLIAHDGSSCAKAALHDLKRAGLPREGVATVVSVADLWLPPMEGPADPSVSNKLAAAGQRARDRVAQAIEEARAIAGRACEKLQANLPDWQVHAEACAGSPGWEIIRKADVWKADLIVVGSHGRSTLGQTILGSVSQRVVNIEHFLLGSVSSAVAARARCSVEVVHPRRAV